MSRSILDLTGQTFGRLTVIGFAGKSKHNCYLWQCRCSCEKGTIVTKSRSILMNGLKFCGCLRDEKSGDRAHIRNQKARERKAVFPEKKTKRTVRASDTARLLHPLLVATVRVLLPITPPIPRPYDCESLESLSIAERRGRLAYDRFDICSDSAGYFVKRVGEPLPEGAKVKERHLKRGDGTWDIRYANFGTQGKVGVK